MYRLRLAYLRMIRSLAIVVLPEPRFCITFRMDSFAKPGTSNAVTAFAEAAAHFLEFIQEFSGETAAAHSAPDLPLLAQRLSGELERWLRAWSPLAVHSEHARDRQCTLDLVTRFVQLQDQLARQWGEVARISGHQLIERLGKSSNEVCNLESAMNLYDLWIDCVEKAYADTVHKDEFCRVQAELANTATALLLQQRKHAEDLARAFGIPTRNEVNALRLRLKDLESELYALRSRSKHGPHPKRQRGTRSGRRPI